MIAIVVEGGMVTDVYTDDPEQVTVAVLVRDEDVIKVGEGGTDVYVPEYDPEEVHKLDNAVCDAYDDPDEDRGGVSRSDVMAHRLGE